MSAFTETSTIEEVEAALPPDELDALAAIGDIRDAQRWLIGDTARHWIDELNLPVRQICKIVGKRTDYGWERVKDFLYVSRFYHERQRLRSEFSSVKYSVFEHAKGCSDPEQVLMAALFDNMPVSVLRETFPVIMDEFKDLYNRVLRHHAEEAREIVETAMAKLKELTE